MESKWIENGGARGYLCVSCLNETHEQNLFNHKFNFCPICGSKMINGNVNKV